VVHREQLQIRDERFSVMLLCGTTVMEGGALENVRNWIREGGIVLAVDVLKADPHIEGVIHVSSPEEAVAFIESHIPKRVQGHGLSLQRHTDDADIFLLLPDDLLKMHKPATTDT